MDIIYNCGYYTTLALIAKSNKKYTFRKRYVTEIEDKEDANYFLEKTASDISWCSKNDRSIPPFMKLEDWCVGKKGDSIANPLKYTTQKNIKIYFF